MKREVILFCLILVSALAFANASHIVETFEGQDSFSVEFNEDFIYNFTVENNDSGNDSQITQVNITIPDDFKFSSNSQFTNSFYDDFFVNGNVLSWTGDLLLDSGDKKYFGFKARSNVSRDYTFKINILNSSGVYAYDINVEVSVYQCIQNWTCAEWSDCIAEQRIRVCYDSNSCGNETGKPSETESCATESICVPVYSCSEWEPENCPKEEIQTRVCTDTNNCGTGEGRPEEERECQANSKLFFIILIVIIVTVILFIVLILIDLLRKKDDKKVEFDRNWNKKV